jgi:hypothetical protein
VPSAAGAAGSTGATVVSVVAGASAGVFLEHVKPVVKANAITAAATINFMVFSFRNHKKFFVFVISYLSQYFTEN